MPKIVRTSRFTFHVNPGLIQLRWIRRKNYRKEVFRHATCNIAKEEVSFREVYLQLDYVTGIHWISEKHDVL